MKLITVIQDLIQNFLCSFKATIMNYKKNEIALIKENTNKEALRLRGGGIINPFMPMGCQMMPCFPYPCYPGYMPNMCGPASTIILTLPNISGASTPSPKTDSGKVKGQSFTLPSMKRDQQTSDAKPIQSLRTSAGQAVAQSAAQAALPKQNMPQFGPPPGNAQSPPKDFQSLCASAQSGSRSAAQTAGPVAAPQIAQAASPGDFDVSVAPSEFLHSSFLNDSKFWAKGAPREDIKDPRILALIKETYDHKDMARQDFLAAKALKDEIEAKRVSSPQEVDSLITAYEELKRSGVRHIMRSDFCAAVLRRANEMFEEREAQAIAPKEPAVDVSMCPSHYLDSTFLVDLPSHYTIDVNFDEYTDEQEVHRLYKIVQYDMHMLKEYLVHARVLKDRIDSGQITDKEELARSIDIYESMRRAVTRHFKRAREVVLYIQEFKKQ